MTTDDNPLNIDLDNITKANWDVGPANRWTYRHLDQILDTSVIPKGHAPVRPLPKNIQNLEELTFERASGEVIDVKNYWKTSHTDGFLVLHDGQLITENYFDGMVESSLHLSQSVCKSVVGILTGIYIDRGLLSASDLVTKYIPELSNNGYAGATIQNLLDMRTGVFFEEDYDNPSPEYFLMDQAAGWKDRTDPNAPETYRKFLKMIKPESKHGGPFHYRSIDTDVLSWVLTNIGGADISTLMSKEIWQKLGCDYDAKMAVDSEGTGIANGGLNASLRDYARFGQMVLNKGKIAGTDTQLVSESWIEKSLNGDIDAFAQGNPDFAKVYPNSAYSQKWWVLDTVNNIHTGLGIHGQFVYIDHNRKTVIVKLSTWPTAANRALEFDDLRMMAAISKKLAG